MRFLRWFVLLLVILIAVPPLWFRLFPEQPSDLPPAGKPVPLPGRDATVNVLDTGNGPALVLVHGLPGSAYDWRALQPELAERGFRTIAYDRVGYGRSSPRAGDDFTVTANSDDLRALLETLQLNDVTLVGWSYGGVMSMQIANDDRVGRIVLVASGGPSSDVDLPPDPSAAMRLLFSKPVLAWRSAVPPMSRSLQAVLSEQAFSGTPQPTWWLQDLAANFQRWDTVVAYRSEIFADADSESLKIREIRKPALILHGDDDRLAPVAIGRYLSTAIPDARYVELPAGSHMLPITHATELADHVAEFSRTPL